MAVDSFIDFMTVVCII